MTDSVDELVAWIREQIAADHDVWMPVLGAARKNGKATARDVLAQCEAHEALLNLHLPAWAEPINRDGYPPNRNICKTCGSGEGDEYPVDWPCATVKHLAGAYRLRPGYRDEWRP